MQQVGRWSYRYRRVLGALVVVLTIAYVFCLPRPLFDAPVSRVLEARDGQLLGARIAADGQWRFPAGDSVPYKFATAIIEFEDRRFHSHGGIDWRGIGRAVEQNVRNRRIVSGGSTISMQVMRLAHGTGKRGIGRKLLETIQATRLEWRYDKAEILGLYAANAPFGGNVVGLDAAAWRYYAKPAHRLSWSEAATLAVLPNSPALIHPGRNRAALRAKRDRLLVRLHERGVLDAVDLDLATSEPLPAAPLPLPDAAPHLLQRARAQGLPPRLHTTLDARLQARANQLARHHHRRLADNGIQNLALLVLDNEHNEVLAYVGNQPAAGQTHNGYVDCTQAPRSTGSILKPWLYAVAQQEGQLLPKQLLPDVPTQIGGFRPENYHRDYAGTVPADRALIRSLNVPMVHLLRDYGVEKFHGFLQKVGLTTLGRDPSHYGLSLILGGAETTLWDITNAYAGMSRTVARYPGRSGWYGAADFAQARYQYTKERPAEELVREIPVLDAGAAYTTLEAMRRLERPDAAGNWERYVGSRPVAWKTGTSFGFRDAWAVGTDARYTVGVWVGNADGEGRPELIGSKAAAPLLFDLFELLPDGEWFVPPYDALPEWATCATSGLRAGAHCPTDTLRAPARAGEVTACTYHQRIYTENGKRVSADCRSGEHLNGEVFFVLPPVQAYYYRVQHPEYRALPAYASGCAPERRAATRQLQFIYPPPATRILPPIDLDGQQQPTIFRAAHQNRETTIYWHLNEKLVGTTRYFHELALLPEPGMHTVTLVDASGERVVRRFEVLDRNL